MDFTPFTATWLGDGRDLPDGTAHIAGELTGERILVPLLAREAPAVTDQIEIAATLARATDASLHITNPIRVPEQTPMEFREQVATDDDHELLDWALNQASALTSRVDGGFLYSRRIVKGVLRTIATHDVDTLVLPGSSPKDLLRRKVTEQIAAHAECDVVVVNGRSGYGEVPSILLPIAGGPHSGLATDVARQIAEDCDAWIDILHVVEEDAPDRRRDAAEEYVDAAYERIERPETTTTWILEAADTVEAIIEQSRYYPLTVIGAPTKGSLRQFIYGSTNRSVRANARSVVLSAQNDHTAGPLADG
ncbi:universal stress protein [Halomarina halobia]|uniref:Universal stress protein n=1 Tax=Halomarina halobia TaxID=3033386 RepID=A0ABD6A5R8_9EURY|nr:universal stress protein [Halomarina sp. PSR21]